MNRSFGLEKVNSSHFVVQMLHASRDAPAGFIQLDMKIFLEPIPSLFSIKSNDTE